MKRLLSLASLLLAACLSAAPARAGPGTVGISTYPLSPSPIPANSCMYVEQFPYTPSSDSVICPPNPAAWASAFGLAPITAVDGTSILISGSGVISAPGAAGGITALTGAVMAGPGAGSQAATVPGIAGVAHEWISAISTGNIGTLTQPAYSDLVGAPTAGALMLSGGSGVNPTGLAPVNGDCAVGAGGVWAVGSCGGGGSLTLTDGVHTVAGVTQITVSGGAVGGSTPNATLSTGGSGCTVSGAAGIVSNNGSSACITDTAALLNYGQLSLGSSGVAGSVVFGNATSGLLTVQPVTGALGTTTASFPANTGTVGELNLAQTWSATQTFPAGSLTLSELATQAGNTVLVNATSGATSPTAQVVASCSGASNALIWTTNTGFGCNTISGAGQLLGATTAGTANAQTLAFTG